MSVGLKEVCSLYLEANKQVGYGSGNESNWIKESDGSTTIRYPLKNYETADWKFNDNFFGGEPYGGRIVIIYENKPIWLMVYYGLVEPLADNIPEIYHFLKQALMKAPEEFPLRGPERLKINEFEYRNKWKGNLTEYSGQENIYQRGLGVYHAIYSGGLINLR